MEVLDIVGVMLKAILFDLDQTLIDWELAEPWESHQGRRLKRVYEAAQSVHPLGDVDPEGFFLAFTHHMGEAWVEGLRTMHPPSFLRVLVDTIHSFGVPEDKIDLAAIELAYDWQHIEGERAYPDVLEVLPELREQGIQLGIITNSSQPMGWRDRELEAVGLLPLFPGCRLSAADVGYLKPHPAIFAHALKLMGVRPEEAVFVGDNLQADIQGAQGLGMHAVLRIQPGNPDQLDESVVPDGRIRTLHDLLPLLDGWYPGWRNGQIV